MANKQVTWLRSPTSQKLWALVGLLIAYGFISRALDTGSYWQYTGGLVFAAVAIRLLLRAYKS